MFFSSENAVAQVLFYRLNRPGFYGRQYLSAPHKPSLLWPPVSFDPLSIKASPPPLHKDVYSAGNKAVRKKAKQVFKWCHCVLLCSVSRSQI